MAFIGRWVTCGRVGLAGCDIKELVMEAMRCNGEATPPLPGPAPRPTTPPVLPAPVAEGFDSSGDGLEDGRRILCSE